MSNIDALPENLSNYAVIVVDMWDKHWCTTTTRRVIELAPHIDSFVQEARKRQALIIHAPSETGDYYRATGSIAWKFAEEAPHVYCDVQGTLKEPNIPLCIPFPKDNAANNNGGCPDHPTCSIDARAWRKQTDLITICGSKDDGTKCDSCKLVEDHSCDAISYDRQKVWNVFKKNPKRDSVIFVGVHLNMCMLYTRGFSMNFWAEMKKRNQGVADIAFVRDLTDSMYSPDSSPYLNHFAATDVLTRFIQEQYPGVRAIESSALLGGEPFRFLEDTRPTYDWKKVKFQFRGTLPSEKRWLVAKGNSLEVAANEADATIWHMADLGHGLYCITTQGDKVAGSKYLNGDTYNRSVDLRDTSVDQNGTKWYIEASPLVNRMPHDPPQYRLHCCAPGNVARYDLQYNQSYLWVDKNDNKVVMQSIAKIQSEQAENGSKYKLISVDEELEWTIVKIE